MNPFPLPGPAAFSEAWELRPRTDPLYATFDLVEEANAATGCPSLKIGECDIHYWTGCNGGDVRSEGTAMAKSCVDGGHWSWDGFAVSWESAGWSFAIDGGYSVYAAGNLSVGIHTVFSTDSLCESVLCSGLFEWASEYNSEPQPTWVARVSAEPASGTSGDFCIDEALTDTEACGEGVGWTVLRGEQTAMVLWDGDVSCDGCGALYVDGVPSGSWCRSGRWW